MKIDNNTFDSMSQVVQDELQTSSEDEPRKNSRWNTDGSYDTFRPRLLQEMLPKQTQDPLYMSGLCKNHSKQNQPFKT